MDGAILWFSFCCFLIRSPSHPVLEEGRGHVATGEIIREPPIILSEVGGHTKIGVANR